jgi:5'-deoxynucleotidase YfbR-like HD superfamily hydrolase
LLASATSNAIEALLHDAPELVVRSISAISTELDPPRIKVLTPATFEEPEPDTPALLLAVFTHPLTLIAT